MRYILLKTILEVFFSPNNTDFGIMKISYKKLWHILLDKNMTKSDLQKAAKLSWGSIARLNKGENIGTDLLLRICTVLKCDLSDIMEIVKND